MRLKQSLLEAAKNPESAFSKELAHWRQQTSKGPAGTRVPMVPEGKTDVDIAAAICEFLRFGIDVDNCTCAQFVEAFPEVYTLDSLWQEKMNIRPQRVPESMLAPLIAHLVEVLGQDEESPVVLLTATLYRSRDRLL